MTPSNMFFGLSKVLPGKVCTATFPPVRFSTSVFHLSIWTQGKVGAGGKFAYLRVMVWLVATGGVVKRTPKKNENPVSNKTVFLQFIMHLHDFMVKETYRS